MNIENVSEDFKVDNQEKVIITSCLSDNIILTNCKIVDIYDINSDFMFISGCVKCSILSSKIKEVYVNDGVKLEVHNLDGKINKYSINQTNNKTNKTFSFHF